ncbi:MAG: ATP-binding protein, partial [Proteobacteria bacterium]
IKPNIFSRYARNRTTGGWGLGLSIVKHLAEENNGRVSFESCAEAGTKFTITLSARVAI